MIMDSLQNVSQYYCLGGRVEQALRYLAGEDFSKLEHGNYEVEGDNIFTRVRCYIDGGRAPETCVWEGHRNYLDIHYVVEGVERFGYADRRRMTETAYNATKDQIDFTGEGDFLTVYPGTFIITGPDDIHLPCVRDRELPALKKVIVKVKL